MSQHAHLAGTEDTLGELLAWLTFHQNKEVFERLGIRKHFNISKVHNIRHYPDSIRSRGTADGFNTEGTERLHIDLAKMGYLAGNKKEYIRQMTVWLRRQESVHQRCLYLQWAVPGYTAEVFRDDNGHAEGQNEDVEVGATEDAEGGATEEDDMVGEKQQVYHVAKKPAIIGASPSSITADFDAPNFIPHFNTFLTSYLPACVYAASEHTVFSIYKRIVLILPALAEVSNTAPVQDVIYATKASDRTITAKGIKQATAAKSSTVLVRVREGVPGQGPLDGLCAAQVHVIFKLPDEFGNFHCPLAYVSWFKPFRNPLPDIGMYQISFSSRNHQRRASIIPITDILRTCHLVPAFGNASAQDLGWTAEKVIREAPSFYLNPYLRHHDFFMLRYLVELHLDEQTVRQQMLEARRARGIRPRQGYVIGKG